VSFLLIFLLSDRVVTRVSADAETTAPTCGMVEAVCIFDFCGVGAILSLPNEETPRGSDQPEAMTRTVGASW
jgi:hypothetical protein